MTAAATLATAPLIAFHFGELSTVTLLANLLALPAVAPAMWLGMLAAAAGQVPGFPVEALNALGALLLAYIAQVASWCARPAWACLQVRLGLGGLAGSLRGDRRRAPCSSRSLAAAAELRARAASPSDGSAGPPRPALPSPRSPSAGRGRRRRGPARPAAGRGLRVIVLDVGQGDAILLQPARRGAGPRRRRAAGRRTRLAAATTPASRASGRRSSPTTSPTTPAASPNCSARCRCGAPLRGPRSRHVGGGEGGRGPDRRGSRPEAELRSGRLRLDVLWPPRGCSTGPTPGEDPNRLALVMRRPLGPLLDAAHRRRRGRVDPDRPGHCRRPQGRPPRQRRRGPRRPARPDHAEAGGDLGGRGQPLRPPDSGDRWRPSPRTASAPCAPTATARSSSTSAAARSGRTGA